VYYDRSPGLRPCGQDFGQAYSVYRRAMRTRQDQRLGEQESGSAARADGAPHSKMYGLVIASLLSVLPYAWSTRHELSEVLGSKNDALYALVRIQRVDSEEYTGVDFSSYRASFDYFVHLCAFKAHFPLSPEVLEIYFASVASAFVSSQNTERRNKAHAIILEAAETVHAILAGSNDAPDPALTGSRVTVVRINAMQRLLKLVGEDANSTDPAPKIELHSGQMAAKDAEAKSPEVLG